MDEENEKEKKWSEMGFGEKVRYFLQNVTVEPMKFFITVPNVFSYFAAQNLNLEKACQVNLKFSKETCLNLRLRHTKHLRTEESQVQQLVASMSIWKTALQNLFPAFLIMFIGSWSDRNMSRKPFMLTPIVGHFLACLGLLFCVYYFYELPMEVAGFVEAFFPSVTGGAPAFYLAVFSYMGDITSTEMRTTRFGLLNMFGSLSTPLGTALSGFLLKTTGFYGVFLISAVLYVMGFVYCSIRIKERKSSLANNTLKDSLQKTNADKVNINDMPCNTIFNFLKDFFDFTHIKETFKTVFKNDEYNRRKKIVFLLLAQVLIVGPRSGESTVFYLFMRYRFNWDEIKFSVFASYSSIVHVIGTLFVVGVFIHKLKLDDALIGIMSCVSKILAVFVIVFAQSDWQIFLAPLADIVDGTSYIAMRSIASKIVSSDELGKLNAVYGTFEALSPLLYGPIYSYIYTLTMDVFPQAFMLLGGVLTLPAIAIFSWMYRNNRRDKKSEQTKDFQSAKEIEANKCSQIEKKSKITETIMGYSYNVVVTD